METDYSKITRLDFEDTVRRYAVFKLLGRAEQEAETDGEIG
jgi:hypothetical protein